MRSGTWLTVTRSSDEDIPFLCKNVIFTVWQVEHKLEKGRAIVEIDGKDDGPFALLPKNLAPPPGAEDDEAEKAAVAAPPKSAAAAAAAARATTIVAEANPDAALVLGACHALMVVEGALVGDPIEVGSIDRSMACRVRRTPRFATKRVNE